MKKDKKWFIDKWTEERDKSAVHDPMYHFINEFITDVKELDEPEALSQKWIEDNTWNNHYIGEPFVYVKDLQNLLVPNQEVLSQEWVDSNSVNASHDGVTEEYVHVIDLKNLIIPKQESEVTLNRAFEKVSETYPMTKEEVYRHLEKFVAHGGRVTYGEPEVLSKEWVSNNVVHVRGLGDIFEAETVENLLVPKQGLPVIPKYVAEWITKHRDIFDLYPMLKRLEKNSSKLELTYKWYRTNTHEFVSAYLTGEYEVEEELYYALIKGHELVNDEGEWSTKYWNLWVSGGCVFPADRLADYDDFLTTMSKEEWSEWGINDSNADFVKVGEVK